MLFGYINIKMVLFLDKNKGLWYEKTEVITKKMKQTREKRIFSTWYSRSDSKRNAASINANSKCKALR